MKGLVSCPRIDLDSLGWPGCLKAAGPVCIGGNVEDSQQLATKIDPAAIQPVIDTAFKYKAIDKTFDAKEMIAPFMLR